MGVILCIGAFYLSTIRDGHNPGGDFAQYILHAENIVQGKNYQDTGYIYNPHYPQLGPKAYPPVYPLVLAPVIQVFGIHLKAMKIENIGFFLVSLFVLYFILKKNIPFLHALAAVGIVGMNPFFWNFKDDVVSDILFLLLILISLVFVDRTYRKNNTSKSLYIRALFCGGLLYLCCGTRTAGIAMLPSFLIVDWIASKKPSLFFMGSIAVFCVCMVIQNLLISGGGSYLDQFRWLTPRVVFHNVLIYTDSMIKLWDNGMSGWTWLRYIVFVLLLLPAAAGYAGRLKTISIHEVFPLFYLVVIVLWPTPQGARFMIPVIPFFLYYAFLGFQNIRQPNLQRWLFVVLTVLIAFSYIGKYRTLDFGPLRTGIHQKGMPELSRYVRDQTRASDVFIFEEPRIFAFCTGRHASGYFGPVRDELVWGYMEQIHADYFVLGESDPAFIKEFIARSKDRFDAVYRNDHFVVYRILP